MAKSFVLYTIVDSGEPLVDCIYWIGKRCHSQPTGTIASFYKPTDDEQKEYCTNKENFRKCPRFLAYQDHVKAMGLAKA